MEGLNFSQKKNKNKKQTPKPNQQKAFVAGESHSHIWLSTIKSAVEKTQKAYSDCLVKA